MASTLRAKGGSSRRKNIELIGRASDLEKVLQATKADLKKAQKEVEIYKDEPEDAKLELIKSKKSFEEKLAKARDEARAQAIEDFKKSEEFETLLGQYGSGSYHYGLHLVRSYLRTKVPDDLRPLVEDLKTVSKLARELELSASEVEEDGSDDDDDGDGYDVGTGDQGDDVKVVDID